VGAGQRLGVLLVSAALAATAGLAAQRTSPAINGLIVGQVVDARTGRAVSGATVWLGGAPNAAGVVRQAIPTRILTGADGRFLFAGLAAGRYLVVAGKSGYIAESPDAPPPTVILNTETPAVEVAIQLARAAAIGGTIQDEAGEPLVRVAVTALRKAVVGGRPQFTQAGNSMTDDRGAYRISNLRPGEYLVAASSPPRAFSREIAREFKQHGGEGHSMGPLLQLEDFVLQLGGGAPLPPPPADGRLQVYPQAFYPGVDSASQAGVITLGSGDEFGSADLALRPSDVTSVRGQVLGPELTATPLLALIRADSESLAPTLSAVIAPAQKGGSFLFPAVPAGDYVLKVMAMTQEGTMWRKPGEAVVWASFPLTVGSEPLEDVGVPLRPGLRVRGSMQFTGGVGMPGAGVLQRVPVAAQPAFGQVILSSMGDSSMITARASGTGTFDIAGLPGGTYIVRVTNSPPGWMFKGAYYGGRDISTEPIEISSDIDGVVIEFTDRWTGLQGSVRDAANTNAVVLVFPAERNAWEGYGTAPRRLRSAPVSPTGAYVVDSLPPGDYYAVARPSADVGEWRDPLALDALARSATRVTVRDDSKTTLDLRMR
jgi:hypothetical protein